MDRKMSIKKALGKVIPTHHGHEHHREGSESPTGGTRSPLGPRRSLALTGIFGDKEYVSSSDDLASGDESEGMSKNAQKRQARKHLREARTRHSLEHTEESEAKHKERMEQAAKDETPEMKARYGELPLVQSTEKTADERIKLEQITEELIDKDIVFRARLHVVRRMGIKLVFLVFRQQIFTIQGVLHDEPGKISPLMIQWTHNLRPGTIMLVKGTVKKPDAPIIGASIHTLEVHIHDLKVIAKRDMATPFSVYEAELANIAEETIEGRHSKISDRTRLMNRIIDLRTGTSQSIFRIQAGVGNLFRSALDDRGFVEIHTPKLQGAATESGASVFKLGYFGRDAFLAQSPQLAKQMAIASDFERVYEIGAIFRAENSNTHRHLTEYTGLDIEMAIETHYHEMMKVIDATIKHIFDGIYKRYHREITIIKEQFPHENLVWLDETPAIPFADAVKLLTDSGWLDEDGNPPSPLEDLHTRDEIRLGQLMKEKYHTDYYILDKFPASARPFYTMPDPKDPRYTNSFDVFVRGQEIISGGQRIHDAKMLEDNMRKVGIDPSSMEEYMDGFRWGAPPHAGAGVGLERIVMLILQVGNIRLASMFPRDPKSFPPKPTVVKLRHPEADTLHPLWTKEQKEKGSLTSLTDRKLPTLEDLIANYGDSTATSWGDERYKIWRHGDTGAAVAYVPSHGHAILPGDPLCDVSQYPRIVASFLTWLKKNTKYKPIWILCSKDLEDVLGERLGWKTLSCVAEERVDPSKKSAESDPEVARKIRHAQSEGVKLTDFALGEEPPEELQQKANKKVEEWLANRKGTQIHLSEIHLFRDWRHRRYTFAEDKEGNIVGVAVLALLAPRNGMQAKYCLDFPGAPSGTIEYITTHALSVAADSGVKIATFGGGAAAHLTPGHHLSGAKVRLLQRAYDAIVKQFKLNRKSEFRAKMGAFEDPVYIAYPTHGLGSKGIRAIMNFFED